MLINESNQNKYYVHTQQNTNSYFTRNSFINRVYFKYKNIERDIMMLYFNLSWTQFNQRKTITLL
jgi:hypothetical protein